jgi:hypothetical protein
MKPLTYANWCQSNHRYTVQLQFSFSLKIHETPIANPKIKLKQDRKCKSHSEPLESDSGEDESDSQNYCVFGLFPSSGILENRKDDASETGSDTVLR